MTKCSFFLQAVLIFIHALQIYQLSCIITIVIICFCFVLNTTIASCVQGLLSSCFSFFLYLGVTQKMSHVVMLFKPELVECKAGTSLSLLFISLLFLSLAVSSSQDIPLFLYPFMHSLVEGHLNYFTLFHCYEFYQYSHTGFSVDTFIIFLSYRSRMEIGLRQL